MLAYERAGFRYADGSATVVRPGRRPAVADVTLVVPPDAFLLLGGASGSGKSTLVRMANGLIPHFHTGDFTGTVRVGGADTRHAPVRELAMRVGVVFQNQEAQLFNATVARELAFGPRHLGLPRSEIETRVQWAAEQTGVTHLLARPTEHLSGGEAARVTIASVLTMRPPMLILDEPEAALDPAAAAALWALLDGLHAQGTAIIVTEHRAAAVWERARSVAALRDGRLIFNGTTDAALQANLTDRDLPVPDVTRLFVAAGLPERPTTVDAAATAIRARHMTLIGTSPCHPVPGEMLLRAEGIGHTRGGRVVLSDVDVALARGAVVALVGANGAGKTTLLRLLAGLERPRRGTIVGPDGAPPARGSIGMLMQNADDALFCRNVREEVAYSARMLHRHDPAWLDELHTRFRLTPLLDRPPLSLSEGEKRRVALAATLAHRPTIVLLDEPTAGQDARGRAALADLLTTLRASGAAVLLATHDLAFAAAHCDRWLILSDGTMIADRSPAMALTDAALLARARLVPTPIAQLAGVLGLPYPGERVTLAPAARATGGGS